MTDDAMDQWSRTAQVSIPAVFVPPGRDKVQALLDAGIFDPVDVPFVVHAEGQSQPHGLGDGITPNLQATLEFVDEPVDGVTSGAPSETDRMERASAPAIGQDE